MWNDDQTARQEDRSAPHSDTHTAIQPFDSLGDRARLRWDRSIDALRRLAREQPALAAAGALIAGYGLGRLVRRR